MVLHPKLNTEGNIYTIDLKDNGTLNIIRKDPGIWFVECGSWGIDEEERKSELK